MTHPAHTLDLPLAPDPNEVRRAGPVSAPPGLDPAARRDIAVHWTPWTPGIPADAGLTAPCRWSTLFHTLPLNGMRHILERTGHRPWDLSLRPTPSGDVLVFLADPCSPLAIITDGVTAAEARTALDQLRIQAVRS